MSNTKRGFGFFRLIITLLLLAVIGFGAWVGVDDMSRTLSGTSA